MSRTYILRSPAAEAARPVTKHVNQHGREIGARNNYPGERHGPLDNGQKARLCIMAREAFERMHSREPFNAAELAAWRREQQVKACGIDSLTAVTQAHWPALEAHFLDLQGESGRAFTRLLQPELKAQRLARFKLTAALKERGLAEGYAAAICRMQYKCDLDAATARQLWRLVFTIRNRKKAEGKRMKAERGVS